ncbi:MAG: hypothetical protein RBS27_08440, partial [Giesbergeria sp.]|nr:hypothetical protein [Giesbergeria sp.]
MEQARITGHQSNPAAQAARGKPSAQGKDSLAETQGAAATGGFMALLASLGDDGVQDTQVSQTMAELDQATNPATDSVAAQSALSGGLLSWQWSATIVEDTAQADVGQGEMKQGLTALLDAAVAGDGRGGGVGAVGQRKMLERLAASDGAAAVGVQINGEAGDKNQSVSLVQSASLFAGQGLTTVQVAGPTFGQGALGDITANLIPSDGPLTEGSLLLQTALQDAAVAGDERGVAAEMQGAAGAAGKRKVLGRLAAGAAPANDAVSAAGAQT